MDSYRRYFISNYRLKQTASTPVKKNRSRPAKKAQVTKSRKNPDFRKSLIYSTPLFLLAVTIPLSINPLFTQDNSDKTRPAVIYNQQEAEATNFIDLDNQDRQVRLEDIGDLTDEEGNDLAVQQLNPFSESSEDEPVEMAFDYRKHRVKKGETLYKLAREYKVSIDTIISRNKLSSAHRLSSGHVLKIPVLNGLYHKVEPNQSLAYLSSIYKVPIGEIRKYNETGEYLAVGKTIFLPNAKLRESEREKLFGGFFRLPIEGRLTSRYGMRKHPILGTSLFHTGVDIAAATGTRVVAAGEGVVIFAGKNGGYGNYIKVRHSAGYVSAYAHLHSIDVRVGQKIKQGQKLGTIGSTGRSTGPHLHFEIKQHGKFINPLRFVDLSPPRRV